MLSQEFFHSVDTPASQLVSPRKGRTQIMCLGAQLKKKTDLPCLKWQTQSNWSNLKKVTRKFFGVAVDLILNVVVAQVSFLNYLNNNYMFFLFSDFCAPSV